MIMSFLDEYMAALGPHFQFLASIFWTVLAVRVSLDQTKMCAVVAPSSHWDSAYLTVPLLRS